MTALPPDPRSRPAPALPAVAASTPPAAAPAAAEPPSGPSAKDPGGPRHAPGAAAASFAAKTERLERILRELGRVVVAFSGGGDSALVLRVARDVLGEAHVLAATGVSPSVSAAERRDARDVAAEVGAAHTWLGTNELDDPSYRANPSNRCYFCKTELYRELDTLARERNATVINGCHAEDLEDWRPGLQAAREWGVRSPLAEAGFTKKDVRRLARARGLSTADKPSFACLASRVPYGTAIDAVLLSRIERAEAALRREGFRQFRVRHRGAEASIELALEDLPRARGEVWSRIHKSVREAGWARVTLDMRGYRAGSLNPETHP